MFEIGDRVCYALEDVYSCNYYGEWKYIGFDPKGCVGVIEDLLYDENGQDACSVVLDICPGIPQIVHNSNLKLVG